LNCSAANWRRYLILSVASIVLVGAPAACRNLGEDKAPTAIADGGDALNFVGTHEWRRANEPLVKEYLVTLPASAVGQQLRGIRLSDGHRWLEGYVLEGWRKDLLPEAHIILLSKDDYDYAYLWLEDGTEPLPMAACENDGEGVRVRRLSGEILPWRSLRPEHGVVYTLCPGNLPAEARDNSSQGPPSPEPGQP
jgi:hypothetical protein